MNGPNSSGSTPRRIDFCAIILPDKILVISDNKVTVPEVFPDHIFADYAIWPRVIVYGASHEFRDLMKII